MGDYNDVVKAIKELAEEVKDLKIQNRSIVKELQEINKNIKNKNKAFPAVGTHFFLLPEILLLCQRPYQSIEATAFQSGQFHSLFRCDFAALPLSVDLVPVFRYLQGGRPKCLPFERAASIPSLWRWRIVGAFLLWAIVPKTSIRMLFTISKTHS